MSSERHLVRLTGWKTGFRTIDLMKLIRETDRVGLRKAKEMVEEVLNGGEVALVFDTEEQARSFLTLAEPMGVIGHIATTPR